MIWPRYVHVYVNNQYMAFPLTVCGDVIILCYCVTKCDRAHA